MAKETSLGKGKIVEQKVTGVDYLEILSHSLYKLHMQWNVFLW